MRMDAANHHVVYYTTYGKNHRPPMPVLMRVSVRVSSKIRIRFYSIVNFDPWWCCVREQLQNAQRIYRSALKAGCIGHFCQKPIANAFCSILKMKN